MLSRSTFKYNLRCFAEVITINQQLKKLQTLITNNNNLLCTSLKIYETKLLFITYNNNVYNPEKKL